MAHEFNLRGYLSMRTIDEPDINTSRRSADAGGTAHVHAAPDGAGVRLLAPAVEQPWMTAALIRVIMMGARVCTWMPMSGRLRA